MLIAVVHAQSISNVDFDEIHSQVSDSNSSFYYPDLLNRIAKFDTTQNDLHFKYLYYGNVFQDMYKPYGKNPHDDLFQQFYNQRKFSKAIEHGRQIMADNPVNIRLAHKMAVCYRSIDMIDTARFYYNLYTGYMKTIYSSGDGLQSISSYVVIKVDDEYMIFQIVSSK